MSWADRAISELKSGHVVKITPRGHSMSGRVEDKQEVILSPCNPNDIQVDDVVLVKVKGRVFLHLVKAKKDKQFLIGNNRGGINGWVGANAIYGKMISG